MRAALIAAVVSAVVAAATGTAATIVVTSKNIRNGTIQLVDISPAAKAGLRGKRGSRGVRGTMGQPGPAGPAGPKGDRGDKGDLAATHLFERYFCTAEWGFCSGTSAKEITESTKGTAPYVLTMSIPGSSYHVTAEVVVVANSPDPVGNPSDWHVVCEARQTTSPAWVGDAAATVGDLAGNVNETTLTIVFGMTYPTPTELGIKCWRTSGSGASGVGPNPKITYALIDAVEVGSFTTSEQT